MSNIDSAKAQNFYRQAQLLDEMDEWRQIIFGAAMVTRMLPNYLLFCELSDSEPLPASNNGTVFTNILALVWEYASGINTAIDFDKQLDKLELITPDPEQFDIYGVWPALDAVGGLSSLLSVCARFDGEELQSLLPLSRSTISHYLDAIGSDDEADQVALLSLEGEFVDGVIRSLSDGETSQRKALVQEVQRKARSMEQSNIGLAVSR